MNKTIILVTFYNEYAMGVRYLETALINEGYTVYKVFYKSIKRLRDFSVDPIYDEELNLLKNLISQKQPFLIGLSVSESMYMETVLAAIKMIKENFALPIVAGGGIVSLRPAFFLEKGVDFVIRNDGEFALTALANSISNGTNYNHIPSLGYINNGQVILNNVEVADDINEYGIPLFISDNIYLIEGKTIKKQDPRKNAFGYDIIASRGCSFYCTYCSAPKLREQLPPSSRHVRVRSVKSVIEELKIAKKKIRKLSLIRFQDESFISDPDWIEEFTKEYKKHIRIPFTIWLHPKTADLEILQKLVNAGLVKVVMGIQSGSERIRTEIFHRYETSEEFIETTKLLNKAKVPIIYYDYILRHPFETLDDLKKSYFMLKKINGKYFLNLHYLIFMPETEICAKAIKQGIYSEEEMNRLFYKKIVENSMNDNSKETQKECSLWYKMIFCYQFEVFKKKIELFENNPIKYEKEIGKYYNIAKHYEQFVNITNKLRILFKRIIIFFE